MTRLRNPISRNTCTTDQSSHASEPERLSRELRDRAAIADRGHGASVVIGVAGEGHPPRPDVEPDDLAQERPNVVRFAQDVAQRGQAISPGESTASATW